MNTKASNHHHHETIVKKLTAHFKAGRTLRVRDAYRFFSSQTGLPRRIKDVESKYKVRITRTKKPVRGVDGVYETEYSAAATVRIKLDKALGKGMQIS